MINSMTRILRVALMAVLVLTASLYLFANADRVVAFSQTLLEPVLSRTEGEVPRPAAAVKSQSPATSKTETHKEELPGDPGLPLFLFEDLLETEEAVTHVVFILGDGTEGNLWMTRRVGDRWYTEAGPLYCRLGQEGLADDPRIKERKTAIGWQSPGALFLSTPVADVSWPGTHSDTRHLCLSLTGEQEPGYIKAGPLNQGTDGSVCLSEEDMLRLCRWLDPDALTLVGIFSARANGWTVEQGMPADFVFLTDVAPDIREDARYASRNNFMGRPLDGYLGNRIVLGRRAAEALARVQTALEAQGLGLLVYDGYRPARAVENIFAWMADPEDNVTKDEYYPTIAKKDLRGIYLAEYSPHTKGIAVDLTLCDAETGQPLDMGTGFDFFSPASWVDSGEVTVKQQKNRMLLRDAMIEAGFEGYSKEWWHFNYLGSVTNDGYDFVIPQ